MTLDVFCSGLGGCAAVIRMKIPCGRQVADECDESFNNDVSDLPDSSASGLPTGLKSGQNWRSSSECVVNKHEQSELRF